MSSGQIDRTVALVPHSQNESKDQHEELDTLRCISTFPPANQGYTAQNLDRAVIYRDTSLCDKSTRPFPERRLVTDVSGL